VLNQIDGYIHLTCGYAVIPRIVQGSSLHWVFINIRCKYSYIRYLVSTYRTARQLHCGYVLSKTSCLRYVPYKYRYHNGCDKSSRFWNAYLFRSYLLIFRINYEPLSNHMVELGKSLQIFSLDLVLQQSRGIVTPIRGYSKSSDYSYTLFLEVYILVC